MPDKRADTNDQTPTMRADKIARRAAALRDNLAKRKSQQRARNESPKTGTELRKEE